MPKARTRAKTSKTGLSGLEYSKSETSSETQESAQTCPADTSWNNGWSLTNETMAGVLMNGMMTGVLLDGTKVGNKRMTLLQAHFHLEVWISNTVEGPFSEPPEIRSRPKLILKSTIVVVYFVIQLILFFCGGFPFVFFILKIDTSITK